MNEHRTDAPIAPDSASGHCQPTPLLDIPQQASHTGNSGSVSKKKKKNVKAEPKPKQCPVVDVSGGESKMQCCKEQYCIGN